MIKKAISVLCLLLPSSITCMIFRLLGHKVGKNVKIPFLTYIYAKEIELGNDVDLRPFVFISVSKLSIGNNSIISFGTQIKGNKTFIAQDNSFMGVHCLINCDEDVKIGFYSGLGPRCTVYTHGSFLPVTKGYPAKFEKVVLEDYVWTGMAVTFLPGTYIESNCIISPGVVLSSRIKTNTLVKFNPSSFVEFDLQKLQRFSKKNNAYYHEEILRKFCQYHKMKYEHNKTNNSFVVEGKYTFEYFPDNNIIELQNYNSKKISYDLDNYYTDYSKLRIHKNFLFFLRRRFGLTLRTKY
ncbi:MAG: hypothetical protein ACC651_05495 [Candidatus Scalindua sp.]